MADRRGLSTRSLALALSLAAFFVCDVSAQAKGKPVPLGTPVGLGVPVAGPVADTAAHPLTGAALGAPFTLAQLQYSRVKDARAEVRYGIKKLFRDRGLRYPAADIYLRAFKRERALELWVRPEGDTIFSLLRTYDICALSGELGPKRGKGDAQVPEGFYTIDRFNPYSDYHLSLHVDYPNRSDQLISSQPDLGGDIMIHGGCNSIGCLALTDEGIKQLYWISVEARAAGQQRIPVDIYPARLDDDNIAQLSRVFAKSPALVAFWRSLKPGFEYFEQHRTLPNVRVDQAGHYIVNNPSIPGVPTTAVGPRPLGRPVNVDTKSASAPLGTPIGTPVGTPLGTPVGTAPDETVSKAAADSTATGPAVVPAPGITTVQTRIDPRLVKTLPKTQPKATTKKSPPAAVKKPASVPLGTPVGGSGRDSIAS